MSRISFLIKVELKVARIKCAYYQIIKCRYIVGINFHESKKSQKIPLHVRGRYE